MSNHDWTEAQAEIIAAIARRDRIWAQVGADMEPVPAEDVADRLQPTTGLDPTALTELVAQGVVTVWATDGKGHAIEGGPYATLTPWGAWLLKQVIVERYVYEPGTTPRWVATRPSGPVIRPVAIRVAIEEPGWHPARAIDEHGDPEWPRGMLPIPARAGEVRLRSPELVIDHRPGPEQVMDDEGKPLLILGQPVVIDPRLKGRPKDRRKGKGKRKDVRRAG